MNADTASPTTPPTPAPAPAGGALPVVPTPGAATPPVHHEHTKAEPNALLDWSKKAWEGLKTGKVGNPKILLLVLAAVAIIGAIWFLLYANRTNDSKLWSGYDQALSNEGLKAFSDDPANANTVAAKIAKLNDLRLRKDLNMRKLGDRKVADRQAAADALEKLRDEFVAVSGEFKDDRTLKTQALLAAADIEMGLIGIPKKGVTTMGVDVKGNGRGQVDKYAGLMKQAADAIGADTEAGKQILATADKYSQEPAAGELYRRLGEFHARFNDPDPVQLDPTKPLDPNAPKAPDTIPGNAKPDDKTAPGEAPKPPTNIPEEKK